jgi:hypothetical protein
MTPKNYRKETGKPRHVEQRRELCDAIKPNKLKCTLPAGWGTDHPGIGPCKHHYGNTQRVVRAAGLAEGKEVAQVLKGMGVAASLDPGEALRWEVNNTLGHVAWHKAVIDTWDVLKPDGSARPLNPDESEFYERYLAERAHLVRAARMAVAADVEGRAMKLAEEQMNLMGDALDRIFAALRLTAAQRDLLPDVVPVIMREIAAPPKPLELEGVFSTDDTLNQAYQEARKQQ